MSAATSPADRDLELQCRAAEELARRPVPAALRRRVERRAAAAAVLARQLQRRGGRR